MRVWDHNNVTLSAEALTKLPVGRFLGFWDDVPDMDGNPRRAVKWTSGKGGPQFFDIMTGEYLGEAF